MIDWTLWALWSTVDFLQQYNGAVTAVATILIGVFTLVLAIVTSRQAKLTREAIDLSRREFNASHRPRISVRAFESFSQLDIAARFIYYNEGDSDAHIFEIGARIIRVYPPLTGGIMIDIEHVDEILGSGVDGTRKVKSTFSHPNQVNLDNVAATPGTAPQPTIFLIGRIKYRDSLGVNRQTGFCRQLDAAHSRWFIPNDTGGYEYAY